MKIVSRVKHSRVVRLRKDAEGTVQLKTYSEVDKEMVLQFEDHERAYQVRIPVDEMEQIVRYYTHLKLQNPSAFERN